MVTLVIVKDLVNVTSNCFTNRIILKRFKKSIIIVLRKEEKKNYSLLGSYRLITLKNTLAKVLEKYVVNIILKTIEEYKLFFWN